MKTETSYFCFHLASKDQFPAADISEVTGQDQMEAQPVQKGRGRKLTVALLFTGTASQFAMHLFVCLLICSELLLGKVFVLANFKI